MKRLLILQGIPGSGKTTWAREFLKDKKDWVRVNRDDLRNMRGDYWIPEQENLISFMEEQCFRGAICQGYNVILDSTNLNQKTLDRFKDIIKVLGDDNYKIEYKLFSTPLDVCIERDANRPNSVGEKVIKDFYNRYNKIIA